MNFKPDKSKFKVPSGHLITQALFLECGYDTEKAVYTFADEDKTYDGKVYPSLKKLYMETEDPTEYEFANTYLYNWEHWQRIKANNVLYKEICLWEEELEVKLRSRAIKSILKLSDGKFEAAKWAADGQWQQKRGRPSKDELAREKRIRERAAADAADDSARVLPFIKKES